VQERQLLQISRAMFYTRTIISAKEVIFSSTLMCLFVSKQDYTKTTEPIFTKICGKVAHGSRKKLLDFSGNGNPDHVVRVRVRVRSGAGTAILRMGGYCLTYSDQIWRGSHRWDGFVSRSWLN